MKMVFSFVLISSVLASPVYASCDHQLNCSNSSDGNEKQLTLTTFDGCGSVKIDETENPQSHYTNVLRRFQNSQTDLYFGGPLGASKIELDLPLAVIGHGGTVTFNGLAFTCNSAF